jgi:hypothetical protein
MRLVADGLTHNGFDVSLPDHADGRRLSIACLAARCTVTVEDTGLVVWDWHPVAGSRTDPRQLADLASALLTGKPGEHPRQGDGYGRPGVTLKGIVGRELTARGLQVGLEIYADEEFFDAHAAIVVTRSDGGGQVYITDDGGLGWDRDYWAEAAGVTWQAQCTTRIIDPPVLAGDIVAAVTQAMAAAHPSSHPILATDFPAATWT